MDHLRENGFEVSAVDVENLDEIKAEHGVTSEVASCHTALVDGYVIEGHVPATSIQRLLEERPEVTGLSVPGMPVGPPGMEGPNPVHFDVVTFDENGQTGVYESHGH